MNCLKAFLVVICISFSPKEKKNMTIFLAGDSTMSIKETKAYPETGWGMPFKYFWDSSVSVINKAQNGRSTKSFIAEGLWKSIVANAEGGDLILIQFGHNDEVKEKVARYSPPDSFKLNLSMFVDESREKKAIPILISPVSRRLFDSLGNALESHPYAHLVKEVANEKKALFIDLDSLSIDLFQHMGAENSKLLFLHLAEAEHPNYPLGKQDNTHFNELGARLIAQIVLKQLLVLQPSLNQRMVNSFAVK